MKLVTTLLTTTILSAVALTASAGKSAFEGTYVGAQLGSSKAASQKATTAAVAGTGVGTLTVGQNKSSRKWGVNGGLTVGHRAAVAQDVILGVSLGVDLESTKSKTSNQLGGTISTAVLSSEVKRKYIVNLLGQAGYVVHKDLMPYLTAGVSLTQFKLSSGVNGGTVIGGSKNKTKVGYAVGAGAAYAINEMVSADLQYLFTGYGSTKLNTSSNVGNSNTVSTTVNAPKAFHTVTVGVKVNI